MAAAELIPNNIGTAHTTKRIKFQNESSLGMQHESNTYLFHTVKDQGKRGLFVIKNRPL